MKRRCTTCLVLSWAIPRKQRRTEYGHVKKILKQELYQREVRRTEDEEIFKEMKGDEPGFLEVPVKLASEQ